MLGRSESEYLIDLTALALHKYLQVLNFLEEAAKAAQENGRFLNTQSAPNFSKL
jgi:hypothetical protein